MNRPEQQQTESEAHRQIMALLARIGAHGNIDRYSNPNGVCVVATCRRENGRFFKAYADGCTSLAQAERAVLDACRVAAGDVR